MRKRSLLGDHTTPESAETSVLGLSSSMAIWEVAGH